MSYESASGTMEESSSYNPSRGSGYEVVDVVNTSVGDGIAGPRFDDSSGHFSKRKCNKCDGSGLVGGMSDRLQPGFEMHQVRVVASVGSAFWHYYLKLMACNGGQAWTILGEHSQRDAVATSYERVLDKFKFDESFVVVDTKHKAECVLAAFALSAEVRFALADHFGVYDIMFKNQLLVPKLLYEQVDLRVLSIQPSLDGLCYLRLFATEYWDEMYSALRYYPFWYEVKAFIRHDIVVDLWYLVTEGVCHLSLNSFMSADHYVGLVSGLPIDRTCRVGGTDLPASVVMYRYSRIGLLRWKELLEQSFLVSEDPGYELFIEALSEQENLVRYYDHAVCFLRFVAFEAESYDESRAEFVLSAVAVSGLFRHLMLQDTVVFDGLSLTECALQARSVRQLCLQPAIFRESTVDGLHYLNFFPQELWEFKARVVGLHPTLKAVRQQSGLLETVRCWFFHSQNVLYLSSQPLSHFTRFTGHHMLLLYCDCSISG